jgi:hypothetical protein
MSFAPELLALPYAGSDLTLAHLDLLVRLNDARDRGDVYFAYA